MSTDAMTAAEREAFLDATPGAREAIAELVAQAPPLTDTDRAELAALGFPRRRVRKAAS